MSGVRVLFKDLLSKLTGFSTPVFGISWSPPQNDRDEARRLIAFLEDRRVLYVPSEYESPHHCVQSVQEIRRFLTDLIGRQNPDSAFLQHVRAMRGECRRFVQRVDMPEVLMHGAQWGHYHSWDFADALGQLRGTFGMHILAICIEYGLDVEDDLARILPASAD